MTTPRFIRTPEGKLQPVPDIDVAAEEEQLEEPEEAEEEAEEDEVALPQPAPVERPTKEANGEDLSDLFRAPSPDDADMETDDLVEVDEEDVFGEGGEDMSDLLEVTEEDVMGEASPPKSSGKQRARRSSRRGGVAPSGVQGLQY